MSDYTQSTFFAPKDLLATGNPNKIIYGSDVDAELSAISTAIATKADVNGDAIGAGTPCTELSVDNLKLDGNKITSTNTDGDIELEPDGTGIVTISSDVGIGTSSPSALGLQVTKGTGVAAGVLFSNAANNWQIETGTTTNYLAFTDNQFDERMRIDASGNVGIGTTSYSSRLTVESSSSGAETTPITIRNSGSTVVGTETKLLLSTVSGDNRGAFISALITSGPNDNALLFGTNSAGNAPEERARIDSSGNLLVGTTSQSASVTGGRIFSTGRLVTSVDDEGHYFRRNNTDGTIVEFAKDGSTVGSIGSTTSDGGSRRFAIGGNGDSGIVFGGTGVLPAGGITASDNSIDLGSSSYRFDDVYATNGTIQTSDRNEKQDIAELDEAEHRVAVACKGLLRKFRWISSVEEKGDDARIHFGIIAQDLQAAFEAEGLDAGRYGMFIHSTWTDEETGEERSRMGVRYSELLAFIIAAI